MELNKIIRKSKAITLVELIIALTMVSVLMLMIFGVIFKKTKASIMSPSGTFYCWKDWKGVLHQRCYSSGGNGVCKGFSNSDNDIGGESDRYCYLNFPELLTKDVTDIKAYIIGGGAAGAWYKLDNDRPTENACNYDLPNCNKSAGKESILSEIRNNLSCFNPPEQLKCVAHNGSDFNTQDHGVDQYKIDKSNFTTTPPVLGKCVVQLYENNPNYSNKKYYVFASNAFGDSLFYNEGGDSSNCDGDPDYKKYPFLYNLSSLSFIVPSSPSSPLMPFNEDTDIKYLVSYAPNYTKKAPQKISKFISANIKFDTTKPLKIEAKDIGSPGSLTVDYGNGFGAGGDTILKSNFNSESVKADGTRYIEVTDSPKRLLNWEIKDSNFNNTKKLFRFCCNGKKQDDRCNFGYQDTGLLNYITLNNPELPVINYCEYADKLPPDNKYVNIDGSNNIGFGLFGYNGYSSDSLLKYYPYISIKLNDDPIAGQSQKPDKKSINPGNGMGGAIIIQWN